MKSLRIAAILLLGASLLPAQTENSSIEGIVSEYGTNHMLSRVTLDLRALDNPNARYPALTSAEGKFTFRNVLPGRYSLVASRIGYLKAEHGQRGPNGPAVPLEIRRGQPLRDIRISMVPSAAISGRVFDEKGEPAINAQMHAWKATYADGSRKFVPVTSQVTNDLGEYRLFGLPPGIYYVSAQPEPQFYVRSPAYASQTPPLPGMVLMTFTAGGSGGIGDPATERFSGTNAAPIYFGGAADELSATLLTVRPGDDQRGVDIPVRRVPLYSFNGQVIDGTTGQPSRATTIAVTPLAPNVFFASPGTINVTGGVLSVSPTAYRPNANGGFTIASPPPGEYVVTVVADLTTGKLGGRVVSNFRIPNPEGLRITLEPAMEITGRIVFEGAAPAPNLRLGLTSLASPSLNVPSIPVASDGSFTLRGVVPGHYLLQALPLPGLYLKSARLAGNEVLNSGLQLDRLPTGPLEIVIAGNPGRVTGTIAGADNQPMPASTAVLVPDDRHRFDLHRSAVADASGQYRFEDVAPGRYKLFAWEDVEKNAWWDAPFMKLHEDRGIPVTIVPGNSAAIPLTAISLR